VYVLKPSILGGLKNTRHVVGKILVAGKKYTLTSALETEVGRREIVRIASLLPSTPLALGLATGDLFSDNYVPDAPELSYSAIPVGLQLWLNSLKWKNIT
jgi:O-succinylbenzoate synthase